MKANWNKKSGILCLILIWACPAFGQTPPPNDNISNATLLTGDDVTFSGTLLGATLEDSLDATNFLDLSWTPPRQSIWWKWIAPSNTALTVQILRSSLDGTGGFIVNTNGRDGELPDNIIIYSAAANAVSPTNLTMPPKGIQRIVYYTYQTFPTALSIPVVAGTNYYIQLLGASSASYTMRLVGSNTPVIIQQPKSQTVPSNACPLFYVYYSGPTQPNFTFQWQFNGSNIVGQTAPMLALTNVDSTYAGNYTVIVGNGSGTTVSQPATLTVSGSSNGTNPFIIGPPRFQSNKFTFSVSGPLLHVGHVQTSTDLINWMADTNEANTNGFPYLTGGGFMILDSGSPWSLNVDASAPRRFYRIAPDVQESGICVNHLQQIFVAKHLFASDYYYTMGTVYYPFYVVDADILPYLPGHILPTCPDDSYQDFDTSYELGETQQQWPQCLIAPQTHSLQVQP